MKKILLLCLALFFNISFADAKNVKVESLSFVNNQSQTNEIFVKVLSDTELQNGIILKKDSIIEGNIVEIIEPKRGKRNGYLIIKPMLYTYKNESTKITNEDIRAKVQYYKELDYKKIAVETGIDVGASFVKGGKYAAHFIEGAIHPIDGESRVKSGFENMYKHSVISFIGKGKDINIKEGDELMYKFYICK